MKSLSILTITENRPEFMGFVVSQYHHMLKPANAQWIVVASMEDMETVKELIFEWASDARGGDYQMITPEGVTRFGEGTMELTIDMTLPPVQSGHCSMGGKRNRALELAVGEYVTWLDDDDMQHRDRIAKVWEVGQWYAKGKRLNDKYHVMVRGNSGLVDIDTYRLREQAKRSHNWYEGLFYREDVKPFPTTVNIGEDYHWSQQFLRPAARCVEIGPPPLPLSVNIRHHKNISGISGFSLDDKYWPYTAPRAWIHGNDEWTGLAALKRSLDAPSSVDDDSSLHVDK